MSYLGGLNLTSPAGFTATMNPLGHLSVQQPFRLVGTTFGASTDTNFWTAATTGAGSSAATASGITTLASGTANNGYGQFQSTRSARFLFAHAHLFRAAIRVSTVAVALNTRRWGAFTTTATTTPSNGVYFELSAAGVLSCVCCSAGTPNAVASGSFNGGVVTSYTVDTNVHAYEIIHYTMGAWFFIDGVLIHRFTPTTAVLYQTLTTPVTFTSINGAAGVTSGPLECWNAMILRLGRDATEHRHFYQSGTVAAQVLKIGAGNLDRIAVSGVAVNSAITLYDNTAASGTVLWASGAMGATTQPFGVDLGNIPFFTGLTLTIATASSTVTVMYE
jgi:hypothetical protein